MDLVTMVAVEAVAKEEGEFGAERDFWYSTGVEGESLKTQIVMKVEGVRESDPKREVTCPFLLLGSWVWS